MGFLILQFSLSIVYIFECLFCVTCNYLTPEIVKDIKTHRIDLARDSHCKIIKIYFFEENSFSILTKLKVSKASKSKSPIQSLLRSDILEPGRGQHSKELPEGTLTRKRRKTMDWLAYKTNRTKGRLALKSREC